MKSIVIVEITKRSGILLSCTVHWGGCHIGVMWTLQRCHSSHMDETLMSHYCNIIVTLVLHLCHSLWLTDIHRKLIEDTTMQD